jgi:hypothetical protein
VRYARTAQRLCSDHPARHSFGDGVYTTTYNLFFF